MTTNTITTTGTLLTASMETRTLRYLLLPYGEPGHTNVGLVTASRGSITIPDDASSLRLNIEHDRKRPVGLASNVEETDAGLVAAFTIANTSAGNDLLEEASTGLRAAVSVEINDPVIRGGLLVSGVLSGAGAVVYPAFASAQLVATDAGDVPAEAVVEVLAAIQAALDGLPTDAPTQVREALQSALDVIETTTAEAAPAAAQEGAIVPEELTATATVPAGSLAARRNSNPAKPLIATTGDLFRALATAHRTRDPQLLAALADIVPANTVATTVPQYVGELWSGRAYQRKIVPLFNHADLSSFEVKGWHWGTKPAVASYAGNKTDVPSNTVLTVADTIAAERIAGAHDIDRKHRDFNDEAFFAAYYKAMTESYAKVSDGLVLADVLAAATPVVVGTVPAGVGEGWVKIIDGALAVLMGVDALPTFAICAPDVWRSILLTRNDDTLGFLNASMGLEDGTLTNFKIVPSAALLTGQVLVGAREAVTVHELGGEAPIRVEAIDVAKGGVDAGVFGYYAVNVHDGDALALVDNV